MPLTSWYSVKSKILISCGIFRVISSLLLNHIPMAIGTSYAHLKRLDLTKNNIE